MCEFCENREEIITLGQREVELGEIISDTLILALEMDRCGNTITASVGSDKYVSVAQKINYCPICGRKLSEE